jgi:hypothetical protein
VTHAGPNTIKAKIESMWASGVSQASIASRLGCNLEYVRYCVRLGNSYASAGDAPDAEDHARHLGHVLKASRGGFPVLRVDYRRKAA